MNNEEPTTTTTEEPNPDTTGEVQTVESTPTTSETGTSTETTDSTNTETTGDTGTTEPIEFPGVYNEETGEQVIEINAEQYQELIDKQTEMNLYLEKLVENTTPGEVSLSDTTFSLDPEQFQLISDFMTLSTSNLQFIVAVVLPFIGIIALFWWFFKTFLYSR